MTDATHPRDRLGDAAEAVARPVVPWPLGADRRGRLCLHADDDRRGMPAPGETCVVGRRRTER
jgi:hypothetical protein